MMHTRCEVVDIQQINVIKIVVSYLSFCTPCSTAVSRPWDVRHVVYTDGNIIRKLSQVLIYKPVYC